MYTGEMIDELIAAAEEVGRHAEERRVAEERELHEIFTMQIPVNDEGDSLMGAA